MLLCDTMKTSNIYVSGVQKGEERENKVESVLLDKIFCMWQKNQAQQGNYKEIILRDIIITLLKIFKS